jgi:hypothetical protein
MCTPRRCHAASSAGGAEADLTHRWLVGGFVAAAEEGVGMLCSRAREGSGDGGPAAQVFSGSTPLVTVVKAAHLRDGDDRTAVSSLHGPGFRRIFAQRQVRPRLVIIRHERFHMPVQRRFAEHNHVLQTLTPNRSDDAFHLSTLPRRVWSRENLLDAHGLHLLSEVIAEDAIAIP